MYCFFCTCKKNLSTVKCDIIKELGFMRENIFQCSFRDMAGVKSEFEPTEDDIKHVRDWLIKMPHLVQDYDDDMLRALIIACKGSLQRFKESFERLNSLGYTHPHIWGHLDPLNESTQYYLNNTYIYFNPDKTDDGCITIVTTSRSTELDGNKYSVYEMARYILMTLFVLIWENTLGESKFLLIYDCRNARLSELKSITPVFAKDFANFIKRIPIRFQGGHHVSTPPFLQAFLNLIKSALPTKISERIHFHSSMEELYERIPKRLLPTEFGGYAGDIETLHNEWKKKVESYRERLILENSKMRRLDHLRPKSTDDELQGTFRKLETD